jgi:hypothetical protein
MSDWIKCSDRLPSQLSGTANEYIVCAVAEGKQYVFSAQWLEGYALYNPDDDSSEEDGMTEGHGWYDVKENADYDGWYYPIKDREVTHWQPLPAPPTE